MLPGCSEKWVWVLECKEGEEPEDTRYVECREKLEFAWEKDCHLRPTL